MSESFRHQRRVLIGLAAGLLLAGCGSRSADPALRDIDGVARGTLARPGSARWTSLFFVALDCPVSNRYAPEITRICYEYGPAGVECLLVYTDVAATDAAIRAHMADYGYHLPAIRDADHEMVRQAGAGTTPEVVVFDADGRQGYRGRIDNLYGQLGRPRQQVTERDLRNALDDLVAGRAVRRPNTQALGCYIER